MERALERGLQAVAAWLSADAAGCRVAASCANLLWRGSLLAAAGAGGAPRLPGALRAFPLLCPRLQQVHTREAARAAAGLHTAVLPLLHEALGGLVRAAAEAWDLASSASAASGGGAPAAEDAAALLAQLRQALVARTCARVRCAARLAGLEGEGGGQAGGGGSAAAAELAAQAQAWGEAAREWEEGALLQAKDFAALEAGVWRATAGGASLRDWCSGSPD